MLFKVGNKRFKFLIKKARIRKKSNSNKILQNVTKFTKILYVLIFFLGLYSSIVVTSNLTSPVDIALDPTMGIMFITDNNRVVRANMDGTHLRPLVEDAVYKASGLSVDMIAQRVYWSDILLDYIETTDYNGNKRQQIIRGPVNVPAPSRITTFERMIYWTDSSKQGVFR